MKFFNFHLMPYRHADLDAIEQNGSAWVTYSNKHYDPVKGAAEMARVVRPGRIHVGDVINKLA